MCQAFARLLFLRITFTDVALLLSKGEFITLVYSCSKWLVSELEDNFERNLLA